MSIYTKYIDKLFQISYYEKKWRKRLHPIIEYIYNMLPPNKQRNNGWIYFNCPMCHYTEASDTKERGNILFFDDGFVYQCFNCKFKCGFTLGHHLSKNCYQFIKEIADPKELSTLIEMVNKYAEEHDSSGEYSKATIKREFRDIPEGYKSIRESMANHEDNIYFQYALAYINDRCPRLLNWSDLMWKDNTTSFLIPCYENGRIVGYSLRSLDDNVHNKYMHFVPQGYVFNYDNLYLPRKYEIITEGQLDALSINCLSILSNEFTQDRLRRIMPFIEDKEIIVMPDRDKAGKKVVDQIINEDLPFSVAYPNWNYSIKDCFDAVKKYGRLYTIYSILTSKESDKGLIKMKSMTWFK